MKGQPPGQESGCPPAGFGKEILKLDQSCISNPEIGNLKSDLAGWRHVATIAWGCCRFWGSKNLTSWPSLDSIFARNPGPFNRFEVR